LEITLVVRMLVGFSSSSDGKVIWMLDNLELGPKDPCFCLGGLIEVVFVYMLIKAVSLCYL
jgi:hypothetical protein